MRINLCKRCDEPNVKGKCECTVQAKRVNKVRHTAAKNDGFMPRTPRGRMQAGRAIAKMHARKVNG